MQARDLSEGKNESSVIAALAHAALSPGERTITTASGERLILARDAEGNEALLNLEEEALNAISESRIAQVVTLETQESLEEYVKRFTDESSVLFASIENNRIDAALDYHRADGVRLQSAVSHRAILTLQLSYEWKAWTAMDGKLVSQLEFVRFLEENVEDIRSPDAATVIEACRDLQALRRADFRSVVREDSENYRIEYQEETNAKAKSDHLTLPSEFILSIPVYFDGQEVEVHALLRWKLEEEGGLKLGFKLKRVERIRQAEFKRIATEVRESTGAMLTYGRRGGS